ncbi:sigma-70 family RNA polymerase sigma factor [Micromonospora sp. STR1_7]|uniref:Sigma-70 family RNA polymerase sigma factor n=1 Tax=Micromonospora parastrephiae TaxID=2806101 RepID=A0ABS1XQ58_9ACTN|nr:sigma-70 family RNA polymerase sigma factor [Micromonospora parastrephiae]MBM0231380.1 sigma-70 family RNA polymerase sigma factor [Micromonospora parastrephiae]
MTRGDVELVALARAGDVAALGVLLARHEAGMRAVALSILGYGPDAEDAVQDAMVVALRRIGEVRDPAAVGPWLRAIVRNNSRMALRGPRAVPVAEPEWFAQPAGTPTPEEALDRTATRDWVWHSIGQLSEPDRLVTLLRYFSDASSYEQIATVCGLPVGTVRSRLSHARRALANGLRTAATAAHADVTASNDSRWRAGRDMIATAMSGDFERVVRESWWPDAEMIVPGGPRGGLDLAINGMNSDLTAGVRQRLRNVVASGDVLIWETDLISPPDDPEHCPARSAVVAAAARGPGAPTHPLPPRPGTGLRKRPRPSELFRRPTHLVSVMHQLPCRRTPHGSRIGR